jgi:hypothetical protein
MSDELTKANETLAMYRRGEGPWFNETGELEPRAKTLKAMWNGLRYAIDDVRAHLATVTAERDHLAAQLTRAREGLERIKRDWAADSKVKDCCDPFDVADATLVAIAGNTLAAISDTAPAPVVAPTTGPVGRSARLPGSEGAPPTNIPKDDPDVRRAIHWALASLKLADAKCTSPRAHCLACDRMTEQAVKLLWTTDVAARRPGPVGRSAREVVESWALDELILVRDIDRVTEALERDRADRHPGPAGSDATMALLRRAYDEIKLDVEAMRDDGCNLTDIICSPGGKLVVEIGEHLEAHLSSSPNPGAPGTATCDEAKELLWRLRRYEALDDSPATEDAGVELSAAFDDWYARNPDPSTPNGAPASTATGVPACSNCDGTGWLNDVFAASCLCNVCNGSGRAAPVGERGGEG